MNIKIKSITIFSLLILSTSFVSANETKPLEITDSSFSCIRDMEKVRGLYVSNLLGNIEGTLTAAKTKGGAEYPAGSVVQLVPTEVMVKRQKGFNAATKDWEFFELTVNKKGSHIDKRGFVDVVNKFGGNCFSCHIKAEPKWDFICEKGHGCDPIPLTPDMISVIQKTDPRCDTNEVLNANEIKAAGILKKMFGG